MRGPISIDKGKVAAIFIDLQEEHRQDRRYLVDGYDTILANVARLQAAARRNGVPLYHWVYIVDLASRPRRRLVRVLAELAAGPPLPQQVPALVQRLLGGPQPLALLLAGQLAGRELPTELMLGVDQLVDVSHDLLVVHAPTVNPCPPYCGPGSVI